MGEMKPKQHIKKHSKITLSKRSFLQAIKQENRSFKTELREQFFFFNLLLLLFSILDTYFNQNRYTLYKTVYKNKYQQS